MKKHIAEVIREMFDVPGCRSVIRLDKVIREPGKESVTETHYYISSLDPDKVSASQFQEYILGHWEVENCLHGQKDRFYAEDKHAIKNDWGVAWTVLTNMGLSLARLLHRGERTLLEVREYCSHFPRAAARRLGFA